MGTCGAALVLCKPEAEQTALRGNNRARISELALAVQCGMVSAVGDAQQPSASRAGAGLINASHTSTCRLSAAARAQGGVASAAATPTTMDLWLEEPSARNPETGELVFPTLIKQSILLLVKFYDPAGGGSLRVRAPCLNHCLSASTVGAWRHVVKPCCTDTCFAA